MTGEHRFLGLWTSTAYHGSPREIPVLRHKVERVIEHFGLDPASHDGKEVFNVLETYPRDELFQAAVDGLVRIVRGVVNLYERRTVRLLVRRDPYHRFYSCLVYVPRDRYNTEVRERIEAIVREGFGGTASKPRCRSPDSSHARVHVVVRTDPAHRRKVDFAAIERRIAEAAAHLVGPPARGADRAQGRAPRPSPRQPLSARLPAGLRGRRGARREALEDLTDLEALRAQPAALQAQSVRARRGRCRSACT